MGPQPGFRAIASHFDVLTIMGRRAILHRTQLRGGMSWERSLSYAASVIVTRFD